MPFKILAVNVPEADYSIIKNAFKEDCVLYASNSDVAMEQIDMHTDIATIILDLESFIKDGLKLIKDSNADSRYKELDIIVITNTDELENEIISYKNSVEKALLESERSKAVLLSNLPGMAYRCNYDKDWTMQFVSDGCYELTGYKPECILNNRDLSYNELITEEYRDMVWNQWEEAITKRDSFRSEYEITTSTGEQKWVLELGQGVFNKKDDVEALEGIILDITDRKTMENSLKHINEVDSLTGLYNHRYLENLLADEKKQITGKKAFLSINLSAVQVLNMNYGLNYSQELIKRVADDLRTLCYDKCRLFKIYENQFIFYMEDYKDKNELVMLCKSIVKKLESILTIEKVGVGIGVVEIDNNNSMDLEQLIQNLLISSENARHNNIDKNIAFSFFDEHMEAQMLRERSVIHELDEIVEGKKNSLFLQFQPILDLKTNRIYAFEALARIRSDDLGLIPPLEFIPLAEKTKLIIQLGDIIIRKSFSFLNALKEKGHDKVGITINISAMQMLRNDFYDNLFEIIDEMQVDPTKICLEITESIFTSNNQELNDVITRLKDSGIKIAIDDFGTGYSSLARERELNVNCLKIDKYFIDKLLHLKPEESITGDIISMAHKLGHHVVAEGVEYEKQRKYLQEHGCDKIQGYLISKPVNEDEAMNLLR